jgi:hypothetical protein
MVLFKTEFTRDLFKIKKPIKGNRDGKLQNRKSTPYYFLGGVIIGYFGFLIACVLLWNFRTLCFFFPLSFLWCISTLGAVFHTFDT